MEGVSQVDSLASGRGRGPSTHGRTLDFHSTPVAHLPGEATPGRGGRLVGWLATGLPAKVLHGGFALLATLLKVISSPCILPHLGLLSPFGRSPVLLDQRPPVSSELKPLVKPRD